ncbi:MAG: hypothetical protein V4510_13220 [bacterium]
MTKPGKPTWVFLKEVLEGDVRKTQADSNDAGTGGGARDLRMPKRFGTFLAQNVFKAKPDDKGRITQDVHFVKPDGTVEKVALTLHPPTASRDQEMRIGTIHLFPKWMLNMLEFRQKERPWFFVLVADDRGVVWGDLDMDYSKNNSRVRDFAQKILKDSERGAIGALNLQTGQEVV